VKRVIGIDVGLSGAIAVLGEVNKVYDMPVHEVRVNSKMRKRIDIRQLLSLLRTLYPADHVFIEKVNAMPKEGAAGAFTFGFGCGVVETCVVAAGIPYTYVTPMKWKKAMNCPKEKDAARMRASQLLPDMAEYWKLKKHDGRAEAALIALYGQQNIS